MNDSAQNNQQPNSVPVDTSLGDGMSTPPFPIGGSDTNQAPAQPPVQPIQNTINIQSSGAPVTPPVSEPVADATAGNQPTIAAAPPPPGDGQTITTFKPVRGKFGPKGVIATIFGIIVLVAATVVGITQVGQQQIFRQRAGTNCTGELTDCLAGCATDASGEACRTTCQNQKTICDQGTQAPGGSCTSNDQCTVPGERCNNGTCSPSTNICQPGETLCGDFCATLNSDSNNCGGCGPSFKCAAGKRCQGGSCIDGANTCTGVWQKWTCLGADKTVGSGCQEGTPQTSTTQPDFDTGICGVQQIDCSNNTSLQFAHEDKSGCGQTPPPGGGTPPPITYCDSEGSFFCSGQGQCTAPCTWQSDGGPNCAQAGGGNLGGCTCPAGVCLPPSGGGKGKCGGVSLQLNGQYTRSNGRVANGWHTATLAEVQALQAGDTIRLTVAAGTASGANPVNMEDFTKGRFSVNGGAIMETTNHIDQVSQRVGLHGRYFYLDYVIPPATTEFTIYGQVFYSKGQNKGWL